MLKKKGFMRARPPPLTGQNNIRRPDRIIFVAYAYRAKYPKAVECLEKDYDDLLTFYDFPAEHWIHIRTTNPIESTFVTVRLRTHKTKGCLAQYRTGDGLQTHAGCREKMETADRRSTYGRDYHRS